MSKSNGNLQPNARARKGKPKKNVKQAAFLAAYSECGNITQAAKTAKVCRTSHNDWLEKDETYEARFDEAHQKACDNLEREAHRRAVEGWEEPVFRNGVLVGVIRRYSDKLLELLLKGKLPQKYKTMIQQERKEEHRHTHTHKLDVSTLDDDDKRSLCDLIAKGRSRA